MVKKIEVWYQGWGENLHLGTLAHGGRDVLFEYSVTAQQRQLQLSPLNLPLRRQAFTGFPLYQEQLPGVFADSLPDGWGRRLMDRCFIKANRALATISPLDRLAFIHDRAMGAFVFVPEDSLSEDPQYNALLALAQGAQLVLAGQDTSTLQQLALTGGSPHGARPKVLVQVDLSSHTVSTVPTAPGSPWLVKFQAQNEAKEVCAIEALYAELARQCLLEMPATAYFDLDANLAGFGIERFDRKMGMRVFALSLAGLLDHNFREPTLDYRDFLRATRYLTQDEQEVAKAFERCVFNVVFHNRDDHSKNFAYLLDANGAWKLAPCFDLTYNTGLNWEHQMTVMGEGLRPGKGELLKLAHDANLNQNWAMTTIERYAAVAGTFKALAADYAISAASVKLIAAEIDINRKRML